MWMKIIGWLITPAFYALDWYLKKQAHDEQAKKDYIAFLEIMQRKGIASVEKRLKATEQLERIKDEWAKEEKENE